MMFNAQFDYHRTFANHHNVQAAFLGWGFQQQNSADGDHDGSDYHRLSNVNLGIQAAYNYKHRYYFDFRVLWFIRQNFPRVIVMPFHLLLRWAGA